jgi:hypothetical protein
MRALQSSNAELLEEGGSLTAMEIELEGVKRELENDRTIVDVMESVVRSLEEEVGRTRGGKGSTRVGWGVLVSVRSFQPTLSPCISLILRPS